MKLRLSFVVSRRAFILAFPWWGGRFKNGGFALMASWGAMSLLSAAPVSLKDGVFDQEAAGTLGLATVAAEHHFLYRATDDTFKYSHHANLAVHRDQLHVMWSSGQENEDWNGQRILWSVTADGRDWSPPKVLVEDPDGEEGPLFAVASGFYVGPRGLEAYYSRTNHRKEESTAWVIHTEDTLSWSVPRRVAAEGHFMESPRRTPSGRLLLMGMYPDRRLRVLYTDAGHGLATWQEAAITPAPELRRSFPEPVWYVRRRGELVMLCRSVRSDPWLYASVSRDDGQSWSMPVRTNLPSATSRMAAGNLPDGRVYCVWNPSQKFGRNPLVIALSDDGIVFDRAWVLRGEPTHVRYPGISKVDGWQYPAAVAWRDALWVAYSVNKEDLMISRVSLAVLP